MPQKKNENLKTKTIRSAENFFRNEQTVSKLRFKKFKRSY